MSSRSSLRLVLSLVSLAALVISCSPLWRPPASAPLVTVDSELDEGVGAQSTVFVHNVGQAGPDVLFNTLDSAGRLLFARGEVLLTLRSPDRVADLLNPSLEGDQRESPPHQNPTKLRLRFESANEGVQVVGREQLPGIVNYYLGNDPKSWYTDISTFESIAYEGLYDGIDLVYSGQAGALKGTYVIAPGANPEAIKWRYEGASSVRVRKGKLVISVGETDETPPLIERQPVAWQTVNGNRVPVVVRYLVRRDGRIGFSVGQYDEALPLTIDPTLDYSTYVGGSGSEEGCGIAVDGEDNIYVAGISDVNFGPSSLVAGTLGGEAYDAFVTKLDPSQAGASQMVYHSYFGGSDFDNPTWIEVDASGRAYVVGYTRSVDFPTTNSAFQSEAPQDHTGMVAQLDDAGRIHYASYLGGSEIDELAQCAVADGLLYTVGHTQSSDFPITQDAYQACHEDFDAAISVLDTTQSGPDSLVYSTCYGGSETEEGLALDVQDSVVYFAGRTKSDDLPMEQPIQAARRGGLDAFLVKLDPSQSNDDQLLFATYLGGQDEDISGGVAADASGSVYWTGATKSTYFPTTAVSPGYGGGDYDAFLVSLETDPPSLIFSRLVGGQGTDGIRGTVIDRIGNVYVTGGTGSADFPTVDPIRATFLGGVAPEESLAFYGPGDPFVAKFDPTGTMLFGSYLGGSGADAGLGIALDSRGDVYVTGGTRSTDLETVAAYQNANAGKYDIFVVRIGGLAPCIELEDIDVISPVTATLGISSTLTATVSPLTATLPITYTWQAMGQSPVVHTGGGLSDTLGLSWAISGTNAITVTAVNPCGVGVTTTRTIEVLPPCEAITSLYLGGPATTTVGSPATFTASVAPPTATKPITYTWQGTDQTTEIHVSTDIHDAIDVTWEISGTKTVTVTAANACNTVVSAPRHIDVEEPPQDTWTVFLPLVLRGP